MEIIIMFGIVVLTSFGIFFGRILVLNSDQKKSEDKDQIEWLRKYQKKVYRIKRQEKGI